MNRSYVLFGLIAVWACAVAWSFWSAAAIGGPGNLETGLKRLDVFFKWQLVAMSLALASAVLGFVWGREVRRLRWIGLLPIGLTVMAVVSSIVIATQFEPKAATKTEHPARPTTSISDR